MNPEPNRTPIEQEPQRLRHFWAIFIEISMSSLPARPFARKSLRSLINIGEISSIEPRPTVSEFTYSKILDMHAQKPLLMEPQKTL